MTDDARSTRAHTRLELGLLDSLVQLSFVVQGVLQRVAERHDASLAQVRLLGILRDREPAMLELARFLNLDKSSMTGLVGRAEIRGLVRRTTTPDDRRSVHVVLTDKGRELARRFAADAEREIAALVEGLSEVDRTRLSKIASQMVTNDTQWRMEGATMLPKRRGV
jgi:DNA-binding MarR family transcriptional regulator